MQKERTTKPEVVGRRKKMRQSNWKIIFPKNKIKLEENTKNVVKQRYMTVVKLMIQPKKKQHQFSVEVLLQATTRMINLGFYQVVTTILIIMAFFEHPINVVQRSQLMYHHQIEQRVVVAIEIVATRRKRH